MACRALQITHCFGEPPIKYTLSGPPRAGSADVPNRPPPTHAKRQPRIGAFNTKDTQEVHVRFSKEVAVFILERPWHKKQITEENPDGTVDVKLNVSLTPEWNGVT